MKIKFIGSDIQSGFTRYAKKEENFTYNEEKKTINRSRPRSDPDDRIRHGFRTLSRIRPHMFVKVEEGMSMLMRHIRM